MTNVSRVIDRLTAIAEPTRRRLLQLLAGGEHTAGDLAARFDVTRSAISQHLGVLIDAGLVVRTRDGRFQRYRLAPEGMAGLRADLDAFWTTELDQLVYDALSVRMTQPIPERQS
jgi:DNA-binding transcriptional ArsR family regulator